VVVVQAPSSILPTIKTDKMANNFFVIIFLISFYRLKIVTGDYRYVKVN
jgi:hypothetical protein